MLLNNVYFRADSGSLPCSPSHWAGWTRNKGKWLYVDRRIRRSGSHTSTISKGRKGVWLRFLGRCLGQCFSTRGPQTPGGPQKPIKGSVERGSQHITVNPVMAQFFIIHDYTKGFNRDVQFLFSSLSLASCVFQNVMMICVIYYNVPITKCFKKMSKLYLVATLLSAWHKMMQNYTARCPELSPRIVIQGWVAIWYFTIPN